MRGLEHCLYREAPSLYHSARSGHLGKHWPQRARCWVGSSPTEAQERGLGSAVRPAQGHSPTSPRRTQVVGGLPPGGPQRGAAPGTAPGHLSSTAPLPPGRRAGAGHAASANLRFPAGDPATLTGREAADRDHRPPLRHRRQAPPRKPPQGPCRRRRGSVSSSGPARRRTQERARRPTPGSELTGRRGTISTEQQWQKYRPGCGDASAMAAAASSAPPAHRAAFAAGRLLLSRRPTGPRTLTHGTHGARGGVGSAGAGLAARTAGGGPVDGGRRGPN